MANMIARLGVLLGIDSAEFVRGIDGATKKLEQFGDAAEKYGKVAATALTAAGIAALNYADQIVDVAKANDVAVGSVLKLRNVHQPVYTGTQQSNKGIDRPVFQISIFNLLSENRNLEYRSVNAFVALLCTRINRLMHVTQHPSNELRLCGKVTVKSRINRHWRDNVCQLVLDGLR